VPAFLSIEPGCRYPLGATPDREGVNFSLFSRNATSVKLLLFESQRERQPFMVIDLDSRVHRTFRFWHVYVRGIGPGTCYAYRVDGPRKVEEGHRFDPDKALVDPYARGITNDLWIRELACRKGDNVASAMRCVVIDIGDYDWEGDRPLASPMKDAVIYETHVRGFTQSPTSGVGAPGTFRGIIEKIPYLRELGITAVELMPVFEFDNKAVLRLGPTGVPLRNYWGYGTVGFFAPHSPYCSGAEEKDHINEFRDMVKALHRAGIEVILDVVYNHTDEGNHEGPSYCFKGIDNRLYYYTVPWKRELYRDFSGCGNTLNCNHPLVSKLILDSLRFWVREMHVDGFRFDLGAILARGEDGNPMEHPPVLWNIELSDELAETKLITEAWDAAGLYQVGSFTGYRWAEWNGHYRDVVRRFVRGEVGQIGAVASKIAGSSDLYEHSSHTPANSVNFVTCHDGFTLADLVSYAQKHNEANGEENRDGTSENFSSNYGPEGETDDVTVRSVRRRQMKNLLAILMLSQGVPMILSGDEVGRTQRGNNNAYCQDNDVSWFDWALVERNHELLRFFKQMIAFRKSNGLLRRGEFFDGARNRRGLRDIEWHGSKLRAPGWDDPDCRGLAFTMGAFAKGAPDIHVMMNMGETDQAFDLPELRKRTWHRFADTSLLPPDDVAEAGSELLISGGRYAVASRSIVVLISK
jgi:glycogen operon protein